MYSVIMTWEVLDENNDMVSTWKVLATDLESKEIGDQYITDIVEEELVARAWVIKTSDIFRFNAIAVSHLVFDC